MNTDYIQNKDELIRRMINSPKDLCMNADYIKSSNDQAIERIVQAALDEKSKKKEEIITEAIKQIIACGDFMALVTTDGSRFGTSYIPYQNDLAQKKRIKYLEGLLMENNILFG